MPNETAISIQLFKPFCWIVNKRFLSSLAVHGSRLIRGSSKFNHLQGLANTSLSQKIYSKNVSFKEIQDITDVCDDCHHRHNNDHCLNKAFVTSWSHLYYNTKAFHYYSKPVMVNISVMMIVIDLCDAD